MMKQTYRLGVSKSYENPNFSKIKEQIMKKDPILIPNQYSAPKQFKPPTPQPQKKQIVKIENSRPNSQGQLKAPLNTTSNRLGQKLQINKAEQPQDLKKSTNNVSQNLKEITFGKSGREDFGKQAFGMSFNKFNNGLLLQSMKLSKDQIEQNKEELNRDMREMDEEEDDEDEYVPVTKSVQVESRPIMSAKSNIENKKPVTPTQQSTHSNKQMSTNNNNITSSSSSSQIRNSSKGFNNRPSSQTPIQNKAKVAVQNNNMPSYNIFTGITNSNNNYNNNSNNVNGNNYNKNSNNQNSNYYNINGTNQKQATLKRPLSGKPLSSQSNNNNNNYNQVPIYTSNYTNVNNNRNAAGSSMLKSTNQNNQKQGTLTRPWSGKPSSGSQNKNQASIKSNLKNTTATLQKTAKFKQF